MQLKRLFFCVLCCMTLNTFAASLSALAARAPAPLSACDGAASKTLMASKTNKRDARAIWLDATHFYWPGQPTARTDIFKLYYSASAQIDINSAQPVPDAGGSITLAAGTNTKALPYFPAGPVFSLTEDAPIREWISAQWLLVQTDQHGKVKDYTHLQSPKLLDTYFAQSAATLALGVIWEDARASFALWAPTASSVSVCIYADAKAPAAQIMPLQLNAATGAWHASVAKPASRYYQYLVDVYVPGTGIVRNRVTDPYSVSLSADSKRSFAADLAAPELAPRDWRSGAVRALDSATDMVIYELHVRDFSINDASVPAAHRGKYAAFTEMGSNGMQHLRALADAGLTDVHLLPVFDFASVPEMNCATPKISAAAPESLVPQAAVNKTRASDCFNWGYDPQHFGAPEGSYASDPMDGAVRIREFRAMVQSLHRIGLRVGMDLVYNHTAHAGQDARSVLDRIVPGYYHRLSQTGAIERSTCCENTATEHAMMAKLMLDTAVRWARDYQIDSFRFDLMAHQPRSAMEALQTAVDQATGRHIQLVGEGWNFGEVANNARFVQASQLALSGSGIATFSDRMRDAVRGGGCCDSGQDTMSRQGFLNGLALAQNAYNQGKEQRAQLLQAADLVRVGLAGTLREVALQNATNQRVRLSELDYAGGPAGYASEPGEVVNYVENHDNPTLFDLNALKLPQNTSRGERARVQMLGAAIVALSQGIAYYHAGIEGLRSKSLDRNSFDSGDWFNRLDWSFQDNYFGTGLPIKSDNAANYALFRPVLKNTAIKPTAKDIRWMRDVFLDWLRIRASTPLLRLHSSTQIAQRLQFYNTGADQIPGVIANVIDGTGLADAKFSRLLYVINIDLKAHTLTLPTAEQNQAYVLHPVQSARTAADKRVQSAHYDSGLGSVTVPARSAAVFVVPLIEAAR
jgi:pullulanase